MAFAHLPRPEAPPRLTEAQSRRERGLRLGTSAPHLEGLQRRHRASEGSREVRAPGPKPGASGKCSPLRDPGILGFEVPGFVLDLAQLWRTDAVEEVVNTRNKTLLLDK